MSSQPNTSAARLLAPMALAVAAIAFFAVVLSSGNGGEEQAGGATATEAAETTTQTERSRTPANYTVKPGDTLGNISEATGVPVERLQELNPELDPQALVSGQKIKLRE